MKFDWEKELDYFKEEIYDWARKNKTLTEDEKVELIQIIFKIKDTSTEIIEKSALELFKALEKKYMSQTELRKFSEDSELMKYSDNMNQPLQPFFDKVGDDKINQDMANEICELSEQLFMTLMKTYRERMKGFVVESSISKKWGAEN